MYRNKIYYIIISLCLLACKQTPKRTINSRVSQLPYYKDASFTPYWNLSETELNTLHTIPDFSFTNQEGDIITNSSLQDKIYVVDYFFTSCPGICPRMQKNMDLVYQEFINDHSVHILSHSVTPNKDSIHVLKDYALSKNIKSINWSLLTGNKDEIYEIGRKGYFIEQNIGFNKSNDEFLHSENFILIDKNKHIRGIYNGLNKTQVLQLIADIKTLKKEFDN